MFFLPIYLTRKRLLTGEVLSCLFLVEINLDLFRNAAEILLVQHAVHKADDIIAIGGGFCFKSDICDFRVGKVQTAGLE